jgi:lysozyme
MIINSKGTAIIESFEGLRLHSYQDGGGVWTIGYGSTNGVKAGDSITASEASIRLQSDLKNAERSVSTLVLVPLNENEFSALVCLCFNIGSGSLHKSTLLKKLNAGDRAGAADEFLKWDRIAGAHSDGLARRRASERALFLEPV